MDNDHGITDELREWAKALSLWWYDPVKNEYTYTMGTMPPSIDAIRLDSNIIAIADRIDAEHERAMAAAALIAGVPITDEDMAEHGWVRLPKDADGEYIHVGDAVTCGATVWTVTGLKFLGEGWGICCTVYNEYGGSGTSVYPPSDLRHYQPPTVEDVLREFADEVQRCCDTADTIAEYATKLRLAGDAE